MSNVESLVKALKGPTLASSEQYGAWKIFREAEFMRLGVMGIITGEREEPDDQVPDEPPVVPGMSLEMQYQALNLYEMRRDRIEKKRADYFKDVGAAQAAIIGSVSPELLRQLAGKTPKEMWDYVRQNFEPASKEREAFLMAQLYALRYSSFKRLMPYLSALTAKRLEIAEAGGEVGDDTLITLATSQLQGAFEVEVRIFHTRPVEERTWDRFTQALQQAEIRLDPSLGGGKKDGADNRGLRALHVDTRGVGTKGGGRHPTRKGGKAKKDDTCRACGKKGHWARECRSKKDGAGGSGKRPDGPRRPPASGDRDEKHVDRPLRAM